MEDLVEMLLSRQQRSHKLLEELAAEHVATLRNTESLARLFAQGGVSTSARLPVDQALDCPQSTANKAACDVVLGLSSADAGRTQCPNGALVGPRQVQEQDGAEETRSMCQAIIKCQRADSVEVQATGRGEGARTLDSGKEEEAAVTEKAEESEDEEEEAVEEEAEEEEAVGGRHRIDPSMFLMRSHSRGSIPSLLSRTSVQVALKSVVSSKWFERAVGVVIVANAVNIGITIDMELRNEDTTTQTIIEMALLSLFLAELSLRFLVGGMGCLLVIWNVFDGILILLTGITLTINLTQMPTGGFTPVADLMESMLILRMLRLLRLARALRLVNMWSPLWKLVQGINKAIYTLLSALVIMVASTFLFACFGAEFVTKPYANDADIGELLRDRFSTIPRIMLTLIQFITQDSIAAFYVPVVHRSPVLILYFLLILIFVSIGLMNIITALIVQDAIANARMDSEMKEHYTRERLRRLRPSFRELFRRLDRSGDGLVQIQELVHALQGGMTVPPELQDVINIARLVDLFDALDRDQSGGLTEDEFIDGLSCMVLADVPPETMQILHLARAIRHEVALSKTQPRSLSLRSGSPTPQASTGTSPLYRSRPDVPVFTI